MNYDSQVKFINELKKSLINGKHRVEEVIPERGVRAEWVCEINCEGEYDDGLQYECDIDITCHKFEKVMKKYNCSYEWYNSYTAVIIYEGREMTASEVAAQNKKIEKTTTKKTELIPLLIDKCEIYYTPKFDATTFITDFNDITWTQKTLKMMGKDVLEPRKTFIGGTEGSSYKFAGLKTEGDGKLPSSITETMLYVEEYLKKNGIMKQKDKFNFCVCNYYENGNNYIGMHSDKGTADGEIIASLSYGVSRHFDIETHEADKWGGHKTRLELNHGDLLIMTGATQQNSKHGVPKQLKIKEPRINLTFRMNK